MLGSGLRDLDGAITTVYNGLLNPLYFMTKHQGDPLCAGNSHLIEQYTASYLLYRVYFIARIMQVFYGFGCIAIMLPHDRFGGAKRGFMDLFVGRLGGNPAKINTFHEERIRCTKYRTDIQGAS